MTLQASQANGKASTPKDEEQATQRLLKQAEQVHIMTLLYTIVIWSWAHIMTYKPQ